MINIHLLITEGNLAKKEHNDENTSYLMKMKGGGEKGPLKVNINDIITGFMGGAITIFILGLLTRFTYTPLLIASFGASCVLAFGLWNSPLSQPRNIIGGHFISTLIGLIIYHLFGNEPWSLALGVGLAIGLMMLTKTTHPPAESRSNNNNTRLLFMGISIYTSINRIYCNCTVSISY